MEGRTESDSDRVAAMMIILPTTPKAPFGSRLVRRQFSVHRVGSTEIDPSLFIERAKRHHLRGCINDGIGVDCEWQTSATQKSVRD
jgi:hypothetical protein